MQHREGGYLISRINAASNRVLNKMLAQANITTFNSEQGKLLYILWQEDRLPLSVLATRAQLALNTVSQMVSTMEKIGLVRREPSSKDKRVKLITLTELGWQGKTQIDAISEAMVELMYGGLTEKERNQLDDLLTRVLHNVSTYESEEQEHD